MKNHIEFTRRETAVLMSTIRKISGNKKTFQVNPCYDVLSGKTIKQITDRPLNDKITRYYGLCTDDNTHMTPGFTLWYDWLTDSWYVGA